MIEPWKVIEGDCLDVMRGMAPASVEVIVCDPPYGLHMMGKHWDHGVPGVEFWKAARDVLKPGGYLIAFGGTRTFHRLTCAIEDAGFEIRDCLSWMYGSGFPKSLDVSKAIDKAAGVEREVVGSRIARVGFDTEGEGGGGWAAGTVDITAPATDAARQWSGWGTALKPGWEPAVMARKPLSGTVAANVLEHGTGAINVDGCRIAVVSGDQKGQGGPNASESRARRSGFAMTAEDQRDGLARWPANVLLDEHAAAMLDEQSGVQKDGTHVGHNRNGEKPASIYGKYGTLTTDEGYGGSGGASRFFYCAKASRSEREAGLERLAARSRTDVTGRTEESAGQNNPRAGIRAGGKIRNTHPTVKPIDLMRWLVRLVTPPGGTVLDPFMGSGSTGVAAIEEGFAFVGIDLSPEYCEIARARIENASRQEVLEFMAPREPAPAKPESLAFDFLKKE